jgi:hypothetical protein
MKKIPMVALALLLWSGVASAEGISISLSSDDPRAEMGPRYEARDAQVAIRTRDRSAMLLLVDDVIAVQLSDATLARMVSESKKKKETGFFEELVLAGVRLAVGKSVEYPIAALRSVDYRDGVLRIVNDQNKPVFAELKVNGTEILRDFSSADAARFVAAVRARKAAR